MNIQNIVSLIKRGNEEEKREVEHRVKLAKNEIQKLRKDFLNIDRSMEKMICFGSLAKNNIDSINFDIDIAVKSNKYYQLVSRAMKSEFKIDVIDLDSIHHKIKENIVKYGKVIYEKK